MNPQTLRLADDLLLIGLDDRTGRLRVETRALSVGLAGALLGELLLAGSIAVDGDRILVRHGGHPPDSVTHAIAELLSAEPDHRLATWVRFLARDALAKVAARLVRDRLIRTVESRTLLRAATVVYAPVDANDVAWRAVRLARLIEADAVAGWPDCLLAGLAHAIGLTGFVLRDAGIPAGVNLAGLLEALDRGPGLADLIACVRSTASARVVAHHR